MKSRIIPLLLIGGFIALFAWIATKLEFVERNIPVGFKGEAARNPFYAAIRLSEELDADASWEHLLGDPPTASVILVSSWNWTLSRPRRERLQRWVENGGRLVVDDTLIGDHEVFEKWTGVSDKFDEEDEQGDEDQPEAERPARPSAEERELLGRFFAHECQPLTEDGSSRTFQVCGLQEGRALQSQETPQWALRAGDSIQAIRVAVGRGSVTAINGTPFTRRDFLTGEHARLFVAATQLQRGDQLLFLTEEEQASIVALLWRYGAPVVLLLAALVVLSLWRTTVRFGPMVAPLEVARRSLAEQIRGTGQFALRFGGGQSLHAAAVRALRDTAVRRFPRYDALPSEERVIALAKATGVAVADLSPALNFSGPRSTHELRNSIAVLEAARRRLLQRSKHGN